jgi:hypothetical protein
MNLDFTTTEEIEEKFHDEKIGDTFTFSQAQHPRAPAQQLQRTPNSSAHTMLNIYAFSRNFYRAQEEPEESDESFD